MSNTKDIRYLNRDFNSLKEGLIEFTKVYYPTIFNDFNETSPGMMFLEMSAYVGDVLNYYIDKNFKESLITHASDRKSLIAASQALGYKPIISTPAVVDLDIYQLLPASNGSPDMDYALKINAGMVVRSTVGSIEFVIQDFIDFAENNKIRPVEITPYSFDDLGDPQYFLAKKTVKAISATIKEMTETIGSPKPYQRILVRDNNLISIFSVVDADGNVWKEVPYLAQDTVFEEVANTEEIDPELAIYSGSAPYLLKLKQTTKRFITRVTADDCIELQFGSGVGNVVQREIVPNPENVGLQLPIGRTNYDQSYDTANIMLTNTYGEMPANTVMTVKYLVGGGVASNVSTGTITEILSISIDDTRMPTTNQALTDQIKQSVTIYNSSPASGGKGSQSNEEIRQNALMQAFTQNRAVTGPDYIVRCYSMEPRFGSVYKAYIIRDSIDNMLKKDTLALNLYCLGIDNNNNLIALNRAIKENLKNYLSQYRMLTDAINIKDAYIVNIGINFSIVTLPHSNDNEVIVKCIEALKKFFDISQWQIHQPIILSDIYNVLLAVKGVQTVTNLEIYNIYDSASGYSPNFYSIKDATRNGVIYPSLDPSIFEVKYPNTDIRGKIATF